MIILLNGPIGVGKTTVARHLLCRLEKSAVVDGELLTLVRPFDPYSIEDFTFACGTVRGLLDRYASRGYVALVVTWILDTPDQMGRLLAALPVALCGSVQSFLLLCEEGELVRRITARNQPGMEAELRRSLELSATLSRDAPTGILGYPIDTTSLSAKEVAEVIYRSLVMGD